MGCWNETCMISNIAIHHGDPVVGVFIAERGRQESAGYCYPDTLWTPAFLPIRGQYNDYGGMENIKEDWNTKFILEQFQEYTMPRKQTKEYRNDGVDPAKITNWEVVNDLLHDNLIQFENTKFLYDDSIGMGPGQIGRVMIHGKVWDALSKTSLEGWTARKVTKEQLCEESLKVIDKADESRDRLSNLMDEDDKDMFHDIMYLHTMKDMGIFRIAGGQLPHACFTEYLKFDKEILVEKVMPLMSEMAMVSLGLTQLRKMWMPMSGKGSQESDRYVMRIMNGTIENILSERDRKEEE